jgi:MFS family permease
MPFIALYLTESFGITMVEMGYIFIIVGIGNMIGGMLGGMLTDKLGRKKIALFGLLSSGAFSMVFAFITELQIIYYLVGFMGLLGAMGGPARQAMLADILPEKQRAEGYGILRVVVNMSATIGPALGGLLAIYGYKWLFVADAVSSFLTAIIFILKIPETKPDTVEDTESADEIIQPQSNGGGYGAVFRDRRFILFVMISMLMTFVYMNLHTMLPVFMRDNLTFSREDSLMIYGLMISMNAFMVVVAQFWIIRKIKKYEGLILMAVGNLLYGIGFGLYGFVATVPFLFFAMFILTIGEMFVAPYQQTITAKFAPEDKRGRYMAVAGFSGMIPSMFGVLGAGAIIDGPNPEFLWYLCFILSLFVVAGYMRLNKIMKKVPGEDHEGVSAEFPEIEMEFHQSQERTSEQVPTHL